MALVFTSKDADINYLALSTDIVDSTIDGLSMVGGILYTTDDSKWYVVEEDLTLSPYTLPISLSGDITVGAVAQGAASAVENWRVNVTQGVMLTDAQLRATDVPVNTGLSQPLTDAEMRASDVPVTVSNVQSDAGGRMRTSGLTTLGDYKILGYDRTITMWNSVGTGTGTYLNNKFLMSVTSGQYFIRQTKKFHPYFSGKSQVVEETFDQFAPQANVTKRFGYFSSNAVAPYQSTFDGFWLESGNGDITLKVNRAGVSVLSVGLTSMSGYSKLVEYQSPSVWDNFTVVLFDFLWLGGAILRMWVKTSVGFVLAHEFNYSGTSQDVFILSPNQPLRYEIVSSTGTGSFRYICSQVASEGSINEMGSSRFVDTGSTLITTATNGTVYPVKAIKKQVAYRDVGVLVDFVDMAVGTTQDLAKWSLHVNPTLSAPLTYTNLIDSPIAHANGNGTITATASGTIIAGGYIQSGVVISQSQLTLNYPTWLGSSISDVMDEYVLCVTPVGGSLQTVSGLGFKIY